MFLKHKLIILVKYFIYAVSDNVNPMSNANGAQGGSDFSAQWIQYYRSMGMHREAEFIEQQAKQMKVFTCYFNKDTF